MPTGKKYDSGKLRFDLMDEGPIVEIVKVLTHGAAKYGDANWKQVTNPIERYYAALRRHLSAWRLGESIDQESGLPHLAHAGCCLIFLIWFESRNNKKS